MKGFFKIAKAVIAQHKTWDELIIPSSDDSKHKDQIATFGSWNLSNVLAKYPSIEKNKGDFLFIIARAVSSGEKYGPNDNGDFFPKEELKKSYPTFIRRGVYVNHNNDDPKKAIGIILASKWNEKDEYVEILEAINRKKNPRVAKQVETGELTDVSMGCYCGESECSGCGNIATEESNLCECARQLRASAYKKDGIYEKNRDVIFIECSAITPDQAGADPEAEYLKLLAKRYQKELSAQKEDISEPKDITVQMEYMSDGKRSLVLEGKDMKIEDVINALVDQKFLPDEFTKDDWTPQNFDLVSLTDGRASVILPPLSSAASPKSQGNLNKPSETKEKPPPVVSKRRKLNQVDSPPTEPDTISKPDGEENKSKIDIVDYKEGDEVLLTGITGQVVGKTPQGEFIVNVGDNTQVEVGTANLRPAESEDPSVEGSEYTSPDVLGGIPPSIQSKGQLASPTTTAPVSPMSGGKVTWNKDPQSQYVVEGPGTKPKTKKIRDTKTNKILEVPEEEIMQINAKSKRRRLSQAEEIAEDVQDSIEEQKDEVPKKDTTKQILFDILDQVLSDGDMKFSDILANIEEKYDELPSSEVLEEAAKEILLGKDEIEDDELPEDVEDTGNEEEEVTEDMETKKMEKRRPLEKKAQSKELPAPSKDSFEFPDDMTKPGKKPSDPMEEYLDTKMPGAGPQRARTAPGGATGAPSPADMSPGTFKALRKVIERQAGTIKELNRKINVLQRKDVTQKESYKKAQRVLRIAKLMIEADLISEEEFKDKSRELMQLDNNALDVLEETVTTSKEKTSSVKDDLTDRRRTIPKAASRGTISATEHLEEDFSEDDFEFSDPKMSGLNKELQEAFEE